MTTGRKALGKGLGALLSAPKYAKGAEGYRLCPVASITTDPDQPRQRFDNERLDDLIQSVRDKGVIQPLVVRPSGDGFIVVAGERRLRAARAAGLQSIPVVVREVEGDEAFELALIENIQREDLDPIEAALAYQRLLDRPGATQQTVARRVGMQRSTVANSLRLLKLETPLQQALIDGELSSGHARTLLSLDAGPGRAALAERIAREGLSVRHAEKAAKELRAANQEPAPRKPRREPALKPYFDQLASDLSTSLGRDVTIKSRGRKGELVIRFSSVEELRSLRDALKGALQD